MMNCSEACPLHTLRHNVKKRTLDILSLICMKMKTKRMIAISLFGFFSSILIAQTNSIDYFGQTPPSDTAKLFEPDFISLNNWREIRICFSPDSNECYLGYTENDVKNNYYAKRINNKWSELKEVTFLKDKFAMVNSFSADNKKIYWSQYNFLIKKEQIWECERINKDWGTPKLMSVNSSSSGNFYSETFDGIGYFMSMSTENPVNGDIFSVCHLINDSFKIENFCSNLNTSSFEGTPLVSSDGSFLIFSSKRPGGYGKQDLYISFKTDSNSWTHPVNLEKSGAKININGFSQVIPALSPDNKYLFFCRHNGTFPFYMKIYWVSTSIIDDLKKDVFKSKHME
jgi:hypothetical protein